MSFGVTKWLGIYSNTQFESVSNKVIVLSSSIVTISMLFFGGQDKINIEGERVFYVKVAGYLGMIYATAALLDAKTRPRLPGFRIFGEISILCSYLSVWFLIYAIFEIHSLPFVAFSSLSTLSGYIACSVWVAKGATIFGCESDPRLAPVIARLGRKDDLNSVLHMATLIAILFKPDVPETADLFKAVLAASPEVIPGGRDLPRGGDGREGGDLPPGGNGGLPPGEDLPHVVLELGQDTESGVEGGSTRTGKQTRMKTRSQTANRSNNVLMATPESKGTMSGGGGGSNSKGKSEAKIGKSRCAEEAKPRKKKNSDELKTAAKARGETISTKSKRY